MSTQTEHASLDGRMRPTVRVPTPADFRAAKAEGREVTSAFIAERRTAQKAAKVTKATKPVPTAPAKPVGPFVISGVTGLRAKSQPDTIGTLNATISKLSKELKAARDSEKSLVSQLRRVLSN
jgi:hypothetical protein